MLYLIATPIGNLEEITYRAVKTLQKTSTIFSEDTRVSKKLLTLLEDRLNIDFSISSKEFISFHKHSDLEVLTKHIDKFKNEDIVYLSDAGAPSISDPGFELVNFARSNDIEYTYISGASAIISALVLSGFEGKFKFLGFLEKSEQKRKLQLLDELDREEIVIIYEAPHRIEKLFEELYEINSEFEVAFIKEISKLNENLLIGRLEDIKDDFKVMNKKGEWCVVIKSLKKDILSLTLEEIRTLNLQPKAMAKIEARFTGENPKDIYNSMIGKEG